MIDRFGGDRTYAFTLPAAEVMLMARDIRVEQSSPDLSLRHIELALIDRYSDAFGNDITRQALINSIYEWGQTASEPQETLLYLEAARTQAISQTGKPIIRGLDLMYTALRPNLSTPPESPIAFFRGDEPDALTYRQKVFLAAGGSAPKLFYNSPAHQVLQLAERFQVIPPGLLESTGFVDTPAPYPLSTTTTPPNPQLGVIYNQNGKTVRRYRLA